MFRHKPSSAAQSTATPPSLPGRRPARRVLLAVVGAGALLVAGLPPGAGAAAPPVVLASAPAVLLAGDTAGPAPTTETAGLAQGSGDLAVLLTLARTAEQSATLRQLAATPLARGMAGPAAEAAGELRRRQLSGLQPAASTRTAVEGFAAAHGFTLMQATSASVLLGGPAAGLAAAFGATLTTSPAGLRYPLAPPVVPAALRAAVDSVVGLDERPAMRSSAVPGGYTGNDLRTAYQVSAPSSTGAGITVGLLQLSGWKASDLTSYASAAGLTIAAGQITQVAVSGANPAAGDGSDGGFEVAMDSEAVLATAPAAKQRLYFAPNSTAYLTSAVNLMADDARSGKLQVASTSWGACEPYFSASAQQAYGAALDRLLAAGVTFYAASGDSGSYDCSTRDAPDNRLAVSFPASYPNVVATGGTTLTRAAASGKAAPSYTETGWGTVRTNPPKGTYAGAGSGGGASAAQPRPAYQQRLNRPGSTRLVPDVSSVGDPKTGLGVYTARTGWCLGGGTSLAAPTWAGLTAAALSSAKRTTGLGNILPILYANPGAFRDITSGSNGVYTTQTGFDLVTGLGSPNWTQLTKVLVGAAPAKS